MNIDEEDFDRAFEETMLHFKRTGKAKGETLEKCFAGGILNK